MHRSSSPYDALRQEIGRSVLDCLAAALAELNCTDTSAASAADVTAAVVTTTELHLLLFLRCDILAAGVVGGLLHGHGVGVPCGLLGARFLLLGSLEETEEAVLEHFG